MKTQCTDMCRLTMGMHSKKCVVWRFCHRANVTDCTYINLDSIAYNISDPYIYPIAPRLQTCTACYCTEYCKQP